VVVVREGKNLRGRLLAILLSSVGQRILALALASTVEAIEARNHPTTTGIPDPATDHQATDHQKGQTPS
jgi:hypothetical protein